MDASVLDVMQAKKPPGVLYHYTDHSGLLGIIRSKELWATHIQYLNDAREFRHAVEIVRRALDTLSSRTQGDLIASARPFTEQGKNEYESPDFISLSDQWKTLLAMLDLTDSPQTSSMNVCVASFSEAADSLSQWRAYSTKGGFSIGFAGNRLSDIADANGFHLAQCLYSADQQELFIKRLVEQVLKENVALNKEARAHLPIGGWLLSSLNRYAPMLKHSSFADECEWRVICSPQPSIEDKFDFRAGVSMLVPFYKLSIRDDKGPLMPIKEVVIGPTPDPDRSLASLKSFLVSQRLGSVDVRVSEVPYRNW